MGLVLFPEERARSKFIFYAIVKTPAGHALLKIVEGHAGLWLDRIWPSVRSFALFPTQPEMKPFVKFPFNGNFTVKL